MRTFDYHHFEGWWFHWTGVQRETIAATCYKKIPKWRQELAVFIQQHRRTFCENI